MAHGDLISWFTPISLVDVCTPVLFSKRKESDNTIHGKVSPIHTGAIWLLLCRGCYVMHESDLPFHKVMNLVGIIRNADNFGL